MLCAANMIAFMPEEQTLFTVVAGTLVGIWAFIDAYLAGA